MPYVSLDMGSKHFYTSLLLVGKQPDAQYLL